MALHESGEDYLEAILMLKKEKGYVRYIVMEKYGRLELTPSGEQVAQEIYERHRWLTQWLIHMGVTPEVAAEDACKIEHDISPETFRCMKEHLDK